MWNYSVTLSFNLILLNSKKKKKNEEKRPNNYSDCIIDLKRVSSSFIQYLFFFLYKSLKSQKIMFFEEASRNVNQSRAVALLFSIFHFIFIIE